MVLSGSDGVGNFSGTISCFISFHMNRSFAHESCAKAKAIRASRFRFGLGNSLSLISLGKRGAGRKGLSKSNGGRC